jgi:hypothetical protein
MTDTVLDVAQEVPGLAIRDNSSETLRIHFFPSHNASLGSSTLLHDRPGKKKRRASKSLSQEGEGLSRKRQHDNRETAKYELGGTRHDVLLDQSLAPEAYDLAVAPPPRGPLPDPPRSVSHLPESSCASSYSSVSSTPAEPKTPPSTGVSLDRYATRSVRDVETTKPIPSNYNAADMARLDFGACWLGPHVEFDISHQKKNHSASEMAVLKEAAEFLLACSCFEEAFPIYLLLWKRARRDLRTTSGTGLSALIGCVRCAVTESDLQVVSQEIERRYFEKLVTPHDIDCLILPVLQLIVGGRRRGRVTSGDIIAIGEVFTTLAAEPSILKNEQGSSLSLLTYWVMTLGFSFRLPQFIGSWNSLQSDGRLPSLDQLKPPYSISEERIFRQNPGPFAIQSDGRMSNLRLRKCLLWCIIKLRSTNTLDQGWGKPRTNLVESTRVYSRILFLYLWNCWVEQRRYSSAPSWTDVDATFDTPVAELLNAMSILIIEESQEIAKFEPSNRTPLSKIARYIRSAIKGEEIQEHAEAGGVALAAAPDKVLAEKFLDVYMRMNLDITYPSQPTSAFLHRSGVIKFLQDGLNVSLQGLVVSPWARTHPEPGNHNSINTASDRISAFAPSLSSSSISSMRRLAIGISQRSRMSKHSERSALTLDMHKIEENNVASVTGSGLDWDWMHAHDEAIAERIELDVVDDTLKKLSLDHLRSGNGSSKNSSVHPWPPISDLLREKKFVR